MTAMTSLRLQRAQALIPTVRPVEGGFRVASASHHTEYLVSKPNGRLVCTCPDFSHHAEDDPGFACKHILAVEMAQEEGWPEASGKEMPPAGRPALTAPTGELHVFHRHLYGEDPIRLKLIKNTRGYSWEIAVAHTDAEAALSRLRELEEKVRTEFGREDEA